MQRSHKHIPRCINGGAAPAEDADLVLRALEDRSWEAYHAIRRSLEIPRSDPMTAGYLDRRIVPGFARLGFEAHFTRTLLGLAAGAWTSQTRADENVVGLHPNMRRDLEDVRQGLLIQADHKMASDPAFTFMTPQDSYDIVQQSMDPAHLHRVIDEVTTPWIILPRAYGSLREDQVHYLPAYLEMIERETNEEALHIFTRIAIEFIANFAIRFADRGHSSGVVAQLVVAGYEAMYWKNLRIPPEGFEDVRVFEHFLSWMKYSDSHSRIQGLAVEARVQEMERQKKQIFVRRESQSLHHAGPPDKTRFVVALRHGCLGIASSLRYFAAPPLAHGAAFDEGMAWGALLFDLKSLFDLLASRYTTESRRTRYYVRDFTFQLQNAYSLNPHDPTGPVLVSIPGPGIVRTKIADMIQRLQHTLATIVPS